MLRVVGITATGWLASLAMAAGKYEYFCQMRGSDGTLVNSCNSIAGCNGTGTYIASATFTRNDGVCEGFLHSDPACENVTHHCYEAADFQLIWDRNKDFVNDYAHEDWLGISLLFHNASAIFVPGHSAFAHKEDVEAALAAFHGEQSGLVTPIVQQVLTSGDEHDDERIIHATGSWKFNGTDGKQLPFYGRWISNAKDHWVMESLVTQLGGKSLVATQQQNDSLFDEISKRAASFADLYNAGNITGLASMYSDSAVIIPAESRPIQKINVPAYFGSKPLGSGAKLESKIVSQAPGNDAVHEVGYSYSTRTGYLARWMKDSRSEWVIETQLFAVFPQDAETEVYL